jgi:hypothetical protein
MLLMDVVHVRCEGEASALQFLLCIYNQLLDGVQKIGRNVS